MTSHNQPCGTLPVANWQHVVRLARADAAGYNASVVEEKINKCWRKARIAARLLVKKESKPWNARDRALATKFARDPGVTNRLIDQAFKGFSARRRNGRSILET